MSDRLTVLMPVYNAEKQLRPAIDSILSQTFTDFEFLIIDDGSADASVEIIRSYNDPRIRLVINEKNLGISLTLNKGIELATTELIARMDADDISLAGRLQEQAEYFKNFPETALLSSSVAFIDDTGTRTEDWYTTHADNCYMMNFVCAIFHNTVMYRKSALVKLGGYTIPYSEDFDLWWRFIWSGFKIGHIEKILVEYRKTGSGISIGWGRKEYESSHQLVMLRNLRHLAGEKFTLTDEETNMFQHCFGPLLQNGSLLSIVRAFRKLQYVNTLILQTPNINYQPADLQKPAKKKFEHALYHFYTRLPKWKALLLMTLISPGKLFELAGKSFNKNHKSIKG
jgi:glycosyltransferase involved in cell wall biosynthesis